jgi:manganese transport protein
MTDLKVRPGSLTARSVGAARGILSGERGRPSAYLAFAGPAVVVSIAYIDPGNFATNIQAVRSTAMACFGSSCWLT